MNTINVFNIGEIDLYYKIHQDISNIRICMCMIYNIINDLFVYFFTALPIISEQKENNNQRLIWVWFCREYSLMSVKLFLGGKGNS